MCSSLHVLPLSHTCRASPSLSVSLATYVDTLSSDRSPEMGAMTNCTSVQLAFSRNRERLRLQFCSLQSLHKPFTAANRASRGRVTLSRTSPSFGLRLAVCSPFYNICIYHGTVADEAAAVQCPNYSSPMFARGKVRY